MEEVVQRLSLSALTLPPAGVVVHSHTFPSLPSLLLFRGRKGEVPRPRPARTHFPALRGQHLGSVAAINIIRTLAAPFRNPQ